MDEKAYTDFVTRALLPAAVVAAGIWFTGIGGVQSSVWPLVALAACYLAGYALLEYAGSTLGLAKGSGLYAMFAVLALSGILGGGGLVQRDQVQAAKSLLLPLGIAFVMPALFEAGMELMKNVQPERG